MQIQNKQTSRYVTRFKYRRLSLVLVVIKVSYDYNATTNPTVPIHGATLNDRRVVDDVRWIPGYHRPGLLMSDMFGILCVIVKH